METSRDSFTTVEVVYLLMDNPTLHSEGINGTTITNAVNSPSGTTTRQRLWETTLG